MIAYFIFTANVIVIAFVGNLSIIVVVALNRAFHTMKHFLLASLALSDFVFATFILASRVVSAAQKGWIFGERLCQGSAFLVRVLYLNTFLHLCAVSYERYRAVVKDPLSYDGQITPKRMIISISVLWILPTIISLGPFLGWGAFEYKPRIYACGQQWDKETTFPFLIISFIVPLLYIFVVNYKVFKVARRLERQVNIQLGSINNGRDSQMNQLEEFVDPSDRSSCQEQDEANAEAQSPKEGYQTTGQAIAQENAGQHPSELWKKTPLKAGQVNLEDQHSKPAAESSQDRSFQHGCNIIPKEEGCSDGSNRRRNLEDLEKMRQPGVTRAPICGHFRSPFPSLHRKNAVSPAVSQQVNSEDGNTTAQGGLIKILKECKAARDVMITISALLVCFLPVWINNVYYTFKDEPPRSVMIFWVHSFYGTTAICNLIIYSVRRKEFRKAVRDMLRI